MSLIDVLKLKASKFYQDEMEVTINGKLFIEEKEMKEFHQKISENTIKRFRNEFQMLTEEEYLGTVHQCIKVVFNKVVENNSLYRPKQTHAIGIDLGTTNSCVSYFKPSAENKCNCVIIPNEFCRRTTASVVSIRDNEVVVGDEADEETYVYPKNTITSVKRLIGRKFNDQSVQKSLKLWSYNVFDDGNNYPKIKVEVNKEEKHYYPEQISAEVLRKMRDISEKHLGCTVTKAVITVPAYFNDAQKEATKDAAKIAGLEVMRIINEPTAAAIAYRLNWNIGTNTRNVLIYDLGGGTFDVAILTISEGEIDVKAVGGDNHLGGDDFDTNVIKYCLEDFKKKYNEELKGDAGEKAICRLRNEVKKCKIKLSSLNKVRISLREFYKRNDLDVELTRKKFEELNEELIVRSIELLKKTLTEASLTNDDIDDIVLVGGSTRIPKVQECLSKLFDGRPLNHSVNPDEAVAVGAAIHAAMLNEAQSLPLDKLKLSDVTPLSLGVNTVGGVFSTIIPKNNKVPTKRTKEYYKIAEGQREIYFEIFEGEKKFIHQNNLLGNFTLTNIPVGEPSDHPITVTFELTDEGILKVSGKVKTTGEEKSIQIIEHKGRITAEKLGQLIKEELG